MSHPATSLLGAYAPGTRWLHRLPAGVKLAGLFVTGVVLMLAKGWISGVAALAVAVLVVASSGVSLALTARALRGLAIVTLLLGAFHAWQNGWPRAAEVVGDLFSLVLLSTALTATTAIDEILDTVTRSLRPFSRFGINPEQVGLAFSLMLRAIPSTLAIANETRDAAIARGLQRDPRARLTPLVIRVVAHAHATGDALHARGIGDD